jgi:hypothetical protein
VAVMQQVTQRQAKKQIQRNTSASLREDLGGVVKEFPFCIIF